jgi:hypothetical protein
MRLMTGVVLVLLLAFLPARSPAQSPTPPPSGVPIQVEDAWARAAPLMPAMGAMPMSGGTGAVYLTLRNGGAEPETLVGAASDAAETVELHETIQDGTVMRMRPVAQLVIPAGTVLAMTPGGLHLMLINLKRALRPGEQVAVTLTFAHAAPLTVQVPVR